MVNPDGQALAILTLPRQLRTLQNQLADLDVRVKALETAGLPLPAGLIGRLGAVETRSLANETNVLAIASTLTDLQNPATPIGGRYLALVVAPEINSRITQAVPGIKASVASDIRTPGTALQSAVDARVTAGTAGIQSRVQGNVTTAITRDMASPGTTIRNTLDSAISGKVASDLPNTATPIGTALDRILLSRLTVFGNLNITPLATKLAAIKAGLLTDADSITARLDTLQTEIGIRLGALGTARASMFDPRAGVFGTMKTEFNAAIVSLALAVSSPTVGGITSNLGAAATHLQNGFVALGSMFTGLNSWMVNSEGIGTSMRNRAQNLRDKFGSLAGRL